MKYFFRSLMLLGAASALLFSSSPARAEDDENSVPMRYPPASVRPKLIVGGLAISAVGYGAALLSASLSPELPGMSYMKIPVAGPWISVAKSACPADEPDCGFTLYLRGFLTVADGLMQLGGLGIAGEGLFLSTEADAPAQAAKASFFSLRPVPILTGSVTGIGVIGRF